MEQKEPKTVLSDEQIQAAVTNDYYPNCFKVGKPGSPEYREFPIKDLDYKSYIAFCRVAKPIIEAAAGALKVGMDDAGQVAVNFDPFGIDFEALMDLAEKDLPHMAWLCLKQSDPKLTVAKVEEMLPRPQLMLEIVLQQVKQNNLVKEFADFFPRLMTSLSSLIPDVQAVVNPTSTTEETPA